MDSPSPPLWHRFAFGGKEKEFYWTGENSHSSRLVNAPALITITTNSERRISTLIHFSFIPSLKKKIQ